MSNQSFDPNYIPADPVAEALDMFARMPVIIGREPDSDAALLYADIAAMMGREGVLDGLDWNDARGAISVMAFDLMERGPDHLLIRAGWIRAEVHNGGPLHEPVRVAEAVERLYNLLVPVPSERLVAAVAAADPRVRLALLLLAETGMRRAELAAMHTDDLLKDANGWSLRVLGKGRRERRVPIGDGLGQTLTEVRRGWVFPRCHRGIGPPCGHLTSAHLGKLVSAALGGGWTAHTIRHRYGTLAYSVDRDLRAVQELMGHQKIETTTVYTKVPDGAMRRAAAASSLVLSGR